MRSSTPLLGVLFLLAAPATAAATCFIDCQATLMESDCTTPPPGIWYAGIPLTFLGACETCCSPPGGPVVCDPTPMDMAFLYVKKDGETLPGTFAQAGATCDDAGNMFLFTADDGPLAPGSYELIEDQENMIIAQFEVIEKVEVVEEMVEVAEEVGEVVEPVDVVDIVAPDSAVLEETAPADDTGLEIGDAGYVTCGTKGSGGVGSCAAGPVAVAPWWLLVFAALALRRIRA
jgi:hypothetical protein